MTERAADPGKALSADPGARQQIARQLRSKGSQVRGRGGSPLYAHLLEHVAQDAEAAGPSFEVLRAHAGEPPGSALALRFLAAVHRLVLEGSAPRLAAHYPSAGGELGPDGAWPVFRSVLEEHRDRLRELVGRPCQTNEVGRCAALLPGFLAIADAFGLPLRILELGASAGLNLNWDRYRYEGPGWVLGPDDSPVRICGAFDDGAVPASEPVVVDRRGCDRSPFDPGDADTRLALRSSVWADHRERLALLDAALELAREHPSPVDRADVCDWLEARLARRPEGAATVVFHSILWQYLDAGRRERLRALLGAAGTEASTSSPLAWLRMEPAGELASVRLTTWPGDHERVVALSGYHGRPVRTDLR